MRRAPRADLEKFLGAFSPEIAKVALRARAFVLEEAPLAHELVEDVRGTVVFGYSFTERLSDAFCRIAVRADNVDLEFVHDNARIEQIDDLRQPRVGRLLRAAMKERKAEREQRP
jgi:hypothetical protein